MYGSVCDKDRAPEITLSSFGWSAPTAPAGLMMPLPRLLLSKVVMNMPPLMIRGDERVCVLSCRRRMARWWFSVVCNDNIQHSLCENHNEPLIS